MRKSKIFFSLLLAMSVLFLNTTKANAYNFTDKIYGKASVRVGYNFKHHVGSFMNTYVKGYAKSVVELGKPDSIVHTRSTQHYVTLSLGYDFYYKFSDLLHPFIGYEATGLLPVGSRTFARQYNYDINLQIPQRMFNKLQEYFILAQRTGIKFNVIQNTALSAYSILGFNVLSSNRFIDETKKNDVGLVAGAGIEVMFLDKFSFALEYRRTYNKGQNKFNSITSSCPVNSNNAMAKFGYYFF